METRLSRTRSVLPWPLKVTAAALVACGLVAGGVGCSTSGTQQTEAKESATAAGEVPDLVGMSVVDAVVAARAAGYEIQSEETGPDGAALDSQCDLTATVKSQEISAANVLMLKCDASPATLVRLEADAAAAERVAQAQAEADAAAAAAEAAKVYTSAEARVRQDPSCSAHVVKMLDEHTEVEVTGPSVNDWYPVKVGVVYGWVSGNLLTGGGIPPTNPVCAGPQVTTTSAANLRESPACDARIVGQIPAGSIVDVYGDPYEGWYSVSADSKWGWIAGSLLTGPGIPEIGRLC